MFTPHPGDPEAVLAYLEPALRATVGALDDGVSFADTTMQDQPWDGHTHAQLVRYRARNVLREQRSEEWMLGRDLQNDGIEIVRGSFVVRTLRTYAEGPPHPGRNYARQRFYQQQTPLPLNLHDPEDETGYGANLILEWSVAKDRSIVAWLSHPIDTWRIDGDPQLRWRAAVPEYAETQQFHGGDEDVPLPDEQLPGDEESTAGGDTEA